MGRSVDYLTNALFVAYIDTDDIGWNVDEETGERSYDEWIAGEQWKMFKEGLIENLQDIAPSLQEPSKKRWDVRETLIILENSHCEIGISEYCGLTSLSIRIIEDDYHFDGLAEQWIKSVWPKMKAMIDKNYSSLNRVGTFSNGEGVYLRTTQPA